MTGFTKPSKAMLIGVAGGSGSGKTYFASALQKRLGMRRCEIVYQDSFYFDQSAKFDFDGGSVNFDHPDSIDFDLLAEKLTALAGGEAVEMPIYDFVTHSRLKKTVTLIPTPIIVVDGILIFHAPQVRDLFDELIFFDTPEDLRFARRLNRDVFERGRTPEGVKNQFLKQVKPMPPSMGVLPAMKIPFASLRWGYSNFKWVLGYRVLRRYHNAAKVRNVMVFS